MNVVHAVAGDPSRDTSALIAAAIRLGHGVAAIPSDPVRASMAIARLKADMVGVHGLGPAWVSRPAVLHADAPVPGIRARLAVRSEALASRHPGSHVVVPAAEVPAPMDRDQARKLLGLPRTAAVVGVVGPQTPEHDRVLEAMAWIDNQRQDVWLAAIGGLDARVRARADVWKIGARLVEGRDDLSLLSAFDLLFVPDGTVAVTLAAMASGVPVVVVNRPSIDGLVTDLSDGLMVPAGDGEAWSRAILATLRGTDRARDRADRAKTRASLFTAQSTADAMLELYR
jgi:glycosyltransferase involved in cell wall biosynthesis